MDRNQQKLMLFLPRELEKILMAADSLLLAGMCDRCVSRMISGNRAEAWTTSCDHHRIFLSASMSACFGDWRVFDVQMCRELVGLKDILIAGDACIWLVALEDNGFGLLWLVNFGWLAGGL